MDLDSDEDKHYSSQESEEREESRPLSRRSSTSQPPRPDFSASSSEDEYDVGKGGTAWKCKKGLFPPVAPGHCQQLHLLSSCGGKKISHRDFQLAIFTKMVARSRHGPRPSMPVWRPAPASNNVGRLDTLYNKHWSVRSNTKWRCHMCSARGVTRTVMFKCVKCDMALCVDRNCFAVYDTSNLCDFFSSVFRANRWSLDHNTSNWKRIFTNFLETYLLHYAIRTLQHVTEPMDAVKRRNG